MCIWVCFTCFSFSSGYSCKQLTIIGEEQEPKAGKVREAECTFAVAVYLGIKLEVFVL